MGIFDLFKKKELKHQKEKSHILLAMPLFRNGDGYQLERIVHHLETFWGLLVTEIDGNDQTAVFKVDGENVVLAYLSMRIPDDELEGVAQYAYNWPAATEELKDHTGHAIVSLTPISNKTTLERFRIFSKIICSICSTSAVIGIYQGNQSLLIPKSQYLSEIDELKENETPVRLWIYFGLRKSHKGNSLYTYGLTAFEKQEIEIINSSVGLSDLYDYATNIVIYILENDVTFNSGETLGYTNDKKIKITSSRGVFVEGHSFKLEM